MSGVERESVRDKPIRVLLWSPKGSGLHYGGPGMSAYRLFASNLDGRLLLSLAHGFPAQRSYELFSSQTLISPIRPGQLSKMAFALKGARWIQANFGDYDVFHGLQGFDETLIPAIAAKRRGLPVVVKLAAFQSDLVDSHPIKRQLRLAQIRRSVVRRLGAVIAISQEIRDELLDYGVPDEKIAYIPNGVDTHLFRPLHPDESQSSIRSDLNLPDIPTLLFVGGLNRRKRPHLILQALDQLRASHYEVQAVFLGPTDDYSYVEEMKSLSESQGLRHFVHFPGFVQDASRYYRASNVLVLPSSNEGMPNAVLEAMASGLPTIATHFSAARELLGDGERGIITTDDPQRIADAATAYLSDSRFAQQAGRAARLEAETRYDTKHIYEAHLGLYRRLLDEQ